MGKTFEGNLIGSDLKFGIVVSRFNDTIGNELLRGAQDALIRHGVAANDIDIAWTPGSFEIPLVAKRMASRRGDPPDHPYYNAIICLGVVIRGATAHFDYVAGQVASGVASVALSTDLPILFGVLTTENIEQAVERAGTKAGNKGAETATAAIEMSNLMLALAKVISPS